MPLRALLLLLIGKIKLMERRANGLSKTDLEHLREIYSIDFALWYDPDNEACARYGKRLHPHIAALNAKFKFKE